MATQPSELKTVINSLCSMGTRDIHRSKISSILFPHLRYFAYYIARGVLARDNTSSISAPDIAILAAALSGRSDYNIGTLIARRLAMNGNKGDLYGGIYATPITPQNSPSVMLIPSLHILHSIAPQSGLYLTLLMKPDLSF